MTDQRRLSSSEIVARASAIRAAGSITIDPRTTRDLRPEVLGDDGRIRVLPAAFWAATTVQERALFGNRTGIYGFPTVELVDHLKRIIGGRSAIEIGAGHGVLAEALGIPATDSYQQIKEPTLTIYRLSGQRPVPYGPNVIEMDAYTAVRAYQPDVVIASWVTRRYNPAEHELGGNEDGVDEVDVLRHCDTYVLIGNNGVHWRSALWHLRHEVEYPSFVFSRASNGEPDFIRIWNRATALRAGTPADG